MRHNHTIEGILFRLRPVTDGDAAFIVSLRSERGGEFFQESSQTEEEQVLWQKQYYERPGDYYFIVEKKNGEPVGTIAAYDIDEGVGKAFFGRWIIVESSSAAVESAWLIYRFIFENLGLSSAVTPTVEGNKSVIFFHKSCGMRDAGVVRDKYFINGRHVNAFVQEMTADLWKDASVKLRSLAERLAAK